MHEEEAQSWVEVLISIAGLEVFPDMGAYLKKTWKIPLPIGHCWDAYGIYAAHLPEDSQTCVICGKKKIR